MLFKWIHFVVKPAPLSIPIICKTEALYLLKFTYSEIEMPESMKSQITVLSLYVDYLDKSI